MLPNRRQQDLVDALSRGGPLSIDELAELLKVSPATIRRDIEHLAALGKIERIRGGARPFNPAELPGTRIFEQEKGVHSAEKESIGQAAAKMIQPGQVVIVSNGTTAYQVAAFLKDLDITVVTYSFPVLFELYRSRCRLVVPSGTIYPAQGALLANGDDGLSDLTADFFLFGAHGVDEGGSREVDPLLIQTERRMASRARRTVLLADSSKFLEPSGMVSISLGNIDHVVSDRFLSAEYRAMLKAAGCELTIGDTRT